MLLPEQIWIEIFIQQIEYEPCAHYGGIQNHADEDFLQNIAMSNGTLEYDFQTGFS